MLRMNRSTVTISKSSSQNKIMVNGEPLPSITPLKNSYPFDIKKVAVSRVDSSSELPEERGMTLIELRQMAARQQHQIEAQQQLLVAKEQRLKFLKQQEARHHALSEQQLETNCLTGLRDKVETQELKLRQLRALRGQVEQQKTNNGNLGTELESIRALFCEKEKELDLAVSKVEELTRQLDEIRKNSRKGSNCHLISSASELENLRRELLYRTKLSEQQNSYICQQREKIANRQQDIAGLDQKIKELNKRLHRKRLLNEQFASHLHRASVSRVSVLLGSGSLAKKESRSQELLDPDHTQDDLAASLHGHHDLGEFSLTKNDPKYQTLPYNTKFTLKDRQSEDSLSSSTEDESRSEDAVEDKVSMKPVTTNMCNFSPRPFSAQKVKPSGDAQYSSRDPEEVSADNGFSKNLSENNMCHDFSSFKVIDVSEPSCTEGSAQSVSKSDPPTKPAKPAVPPKPALSVKPMLTNPLFRRKDETEQDTVSIALTFLKNKLSEKEKNDFRYSNARDSSQDPLLPKSRILTYFSKTLLQPDGSSVDPTDKIDSSAMAPRRRTALGQLPIKPKPLTIRKTPGIEPPKLKVQPVATLTPNRKTSESPPACFTPKVLKHSSVSESNKSSHQNCDSEDASLSAPVPTDRAEDPNRMEDHSLMDASESENGGKNEEIETPIDELGYTAVESDGGEYEHQPEMSLHPTKKGNLKCEGTIRGGRRVSFDPLALLLDAALEGELELVRKTANEVVNPSAANDEGITALHNAICAGHFDVVKFLVEFGCDVNAQDSDGWTPLHCAASCNNLAMVKFLVERGACIFATTLSDQETAAEKCEEDEEGFDGCSEYLFSLQENLGILNGSVVYAVYDYEGQNADELSFRSSERLLVLRRSDKEENEWWWSRLNDQEGYVPRNLLGLYPRVTCSKNLPSD